MIPLLVELAIFNDELFQIAMDPTERLPSTHPNEISELQFLSVSASYEDFKDDSSLLRAWHRASRLVVDRDKESTVGDRDPTRLVPAFARVICPALI